MKFLAWIRKVHYALHKCAESIRRSEERKRNEEMPVNEPTEVRAVVSFDNKTVRDAETEHEEDRRIQRSIKNAAWCAFVAASIYALIAAYQGCEMRRATVATEKAAEAAKQQVDLAQLTIEGTNAASIRLNDIEGAQPDFPYLRIANVGKVAAPILSGSYEVFRVDLISGQKTKVDEGKFEKTEILPVGEHEENVTTVGFRAPGLSLTQACRSIQGQESFQIRGEISYQNGFGHTRIEQFIWETYADSYSLGSGTIFILAWADHGLAQGRLANLRKTNHQCPEKPN
jgi:hypothetical protein